MPPQSEVLAFRVLEALIFTGIGVGFFALAFWLMCRYSPFSIRKEIEEDQNIAVAIIIGSVILGIAWIIASAMQG